MLTYKRKLILTAAQQQRIDGWIGTCRFIYNMAFEIKKETWKNKQVSLHKYELMKQLTEIRDIYWIADAPRDSLDDAIVRLDIAYTSFFKGGGFPKWATKRSYKSITLKGAGLSIKNGVVYVPKLRRLKIFNDFEIKGNVKIAQIIKESTGYFICITTDAIKNIQCHDESQVIALDMGIANFYVDSNGQYCQNPKHYKKYEAKLRIEQRSLSRKKRGSNSRKRQSRKLALLHHKIANTRKDFLHKESTKIAKSNHYVILEDLNVQGMKQRLGKSISDAGWAMFRTMLSYKTTVVAIDPKYTSQTCNSCGEKDKKSRISQSKFVCTSCGEETNADENAALNILGKGIPLIRKRSALAQA